MCIVCWGITKTYGTQTVLDHVTVTFDRGQIHGLIGRNGSGKTMLMKCICGYVKPDEGTVTINNKRIGVDMEFPKNLGLMLETPGFLPRFSGAFNLSMLCAIQHKVDKQAVEQAMYSVGLDPRSRKSVGHYSLGMRQRLAIAQAIMEDPELLILDEPFNGLDEKGVDEIRRLLMFLRDKGKTIILSSHYAQDIELLCDTVHIMQAGKISELNQTKSNQGA